MPVDHLICARAADVDVSSNGSSRPGLDLPASAMQRVRQFTDALRLRHSAADDLRYRQLIGERAWTVAQYLTPYDRHHHLQVHDWLLAHGRLDADLLQAALLHDIGKVAPGVRITVVHRAVHVLARRAGLAGWVLRNAVGLRAGLQVLHTHPARGAAMATSFGTSSRAVGLIARHHDAVGVAADAALRALQDADHAVGA